jgi:hypothetical protein
VNGDGFADLIVGAYGDDPSGNDSGASFVVFGGQGSSATVGTSGADALDGDSSANQLVAGLGDDTLVGNGGADVLRGGGGDDVLAISDANFASLDGGLGIDTLRLDANLDFDLTSISNTRLSSLEVIDLNNTGATLTLNTDDVLTIVGDEAANDLRITGQVGDTVDLNGNGFAASGSTEVIDTVTYNVYTNSNLDSSVRLLVAQSLTVVGEPIAAIELSAIEENSNAGGFVINGVSAGDNSGWSVSSAGDVNGDGLADLIVGAHRDGPNGNSRSGASFVVFGKTDGSAVALSTVELSTGGIGGFVINGVGSFDYSGHSVSSAGDVNGDGLADLIVGAYRDDPNGNSDSGASFVVFGKTDGSAVALSALELTTGGIGGFVINGVSGGDYSGFSVSSAGDVNGDGLADLIVGAPKASASYVVFGKTDGSAVALATLEADNGGFVINGVSAGDFSGHSVSSAGDVNGDGLADLIVGAYRDAPNNYNSGASFVVFGKTDGTAVALSALETDNDSGGFVINGVGVNDQSGRSVSSAGDVNGDGLADLIVGALNDDPNGRTSSGASFVVFGKTDGTAVALSTVEAGTGGFVINGVSAGDLSGNSVSSAGDVNGDGLADLIVGAWGDDPNGSYSGASFVVFGKTDGSAVALSLVEAGIGGFVINGVSANDLSGYSVSSAGDVNGDGFADLIVSASRDDPNGHADSGASFVVFGGQGSSATVGTSGADALTGDSRANQLVAGLGDDTLVGNGGADVLRGGGGDDVLAISDANFASLDGGLGIDTLRLDAALSLDFSSVANIKLQSIERIDLTADGGNSQVTMNLTDVLNLSENTNVLSVFGDTGDRVNLSNTSNGQSGSWSFTNTGGVDTYVFNAGGDVLATVLIDDMVTTNVI